jgi:hypothetical protein
MTRKRPRKETRGTVHGQPGDTIRVDSDWLGWAGPIGHPHSPAGGGGPGASARFTLEHQASDDLPDPWQPGPAQPVPLEGAPAPSSPKTPPATNARSLGTLKSVQNDLMDVEVDAEIVADGTQGSSGAETTFRGGQVTSSPGYDADAHGKITRFSGKFTWKGTVVIQTAYGPGAAPDQVSCYGRGTTAEDLRDGNVTLGFHESCHRDDYAGYLKANSLPDPPAMSIGMKAKDYDAATADFGKALKAYFKAMKDDSIATTDEVGHKRSTWQRTGKCFLHPVP